MTKRRVFYSFHYDQDAWRTGQVRNIGKVEGNQPAADNQWESIKKGGDKAIKQWIDDQMSRRSCTVVLVGTKTAGRKWIDYEILKSWRDGMGVVGIRIHGLKGDDGKVSAKGGNPFSHIAGIPSAVQCYDPAGDTSTGRYAWISKYLAGAVEKAIEIRNDN